MKTILLLSNNWYMLCVILCTFKFNLKCVCYLIVVCRTIALSYVCDCCVVVAKLDRVLISCVYTVLYYTVIL